MGATYVRRLVYEKAIFSDAPAGDKRRPRAVKRDKVERALNLSRFTARGSRLFTVHAQDYLAERLVRFEAGVGGVYSSEVEGAVDDGAHEAAREERDDFGGEAADGRRLLLGRARAQHRPDDAETLPHDVPKVVRDRRATE